jgi:HEAT repeat protein
MRLASSPIKQPLKFYGDPRYGRIMPMPMLPGWKAGCSFLLPLFLLSQPLLSQTQPAPAPDQSQAQQAPAAPPKPTNKPQLDRIHAIEKGKGGGMSELAAFAKDPDPKVRIEAIKAIVKMGGTPSLDPLIPATKDVDAEVRVRATDGIVNVYLPGYVSGYFTHSVRTVKSWFSARNDSVIDEDVTVRPDAAQAITEEINFGTEMPPRANAALAAGVLRVKGAVPTLLEALRAKNNDLIFESLIALQKIHDPSAGPGVGFLVRDLDERTQVTALQTVGVLGSREAAPDVRYAITNARNLKIRRAAVSALAMLAIPEDRPLFKQYVMNGDPELRTAALEGLGRLREPEDTPTLQTSLDEANADWRVHLGAAFALVYEGNVSTDEFSPLLYLVENLNSRQRDDSANAYLRELMHHEDVRKAIPKTIEEASRSSKIALCWIFASSHSPDLLPALTQLARDPDAEISTAAKRASSVIQQPRQTP